MRPGSQYAYRSKMQVLIYALTIFCLQIQVCCENAEKNQKCTIKELKDARLDHADCFDNNFKLLFLTVNGSGYSDVFC